jgi:hypothetical protein
MDECYHSKHGATGSPTCFYIKKIVFISKQTNFNIEIGFGTGLNAFITF